MEKNIRDGSFDFSTIDSKLTDLQKYSGGAAAAVIAHATADTLKKENVAKVLYENNDWPQQGGGGTGRYFGNKIDRLERTLKEFKI